MSFGDGPDTGMLRSPARPEYFADPFVVRTPDGGYAAFGTQPDGGTEQRVFEVLLSEDLSSWRPGGFALERLSPDMGDEYWAPEVCRRDDSWWMYYSVGHGIDWHQLRVARSSEVAGPFIDVGVNLTPGESFAIDPHPFRDADGQWYLFYARDVLDAERPGTHLAVGRLDDPTTLADVRGALAPNADWQIYERDRHMYGVVQDWHTLEGPTVVNRDDRYWMTFSGGAWTGPGYAVSWATADHPLGPWSHAPAGSPAVLESGPTLIGPGHNSLVVAPDGTDRIAFHAWNAEGSRRQMHLAPVVFTGSGPAVTLD